MKTVNKNPNNYGRDFKKRIQPLVEYYKNCEDKTLGIGDIKQMDKYGRLITELRREYKLGKLFPEEIELLEYMGMKWGSTFKESIKPLKVWCSKNGTLKNANNYSQLELNVDGEIIHYNIGGLIEKFRIAKRDGELSEPQIQILDIMGIVWEPRKADILYEHLIAYGEEMGTLQNIPQNMEYTIEGKTRNIYRQALRLRQKYIKGELNKETIELFAKYNLWHGLENKVDSGLTI